MKRRCKATAAAIILMIAHRVAASPVAADPAPRTHVVTEEPRLLCAPPAPPVRCMDLPPGHFVDQGTWSALDVSLKTAQDDRTRLAAENKSLRASAALWQPGFYTLAGAVLVGLAGGWYVHGKL